MAPSLDMLCGDLAAEHEALEALVLDADEATMDLPTPSPGWRVRDQIAHLAFFDGATRMAVSDPAGFDEERTLALADPDTYGQRAISAGDGLSASELLNWWRSERRELLELLRGRDPKSRVPWYGPSMSAASKVTARIMETWAHGQDVADALGRQREPSDRLRHVAHVGVGARAFSYVNRGMDVPNEPIYVELTAPSGARWTWGEAGRDQVRGPALDFCLLITQRRHRDDVELEVEGDLAEEWIQIGQAFAGPPGEGRRAGQFPESVSGR